MTTIKKGVFKEGDKVTCRIYEHHIKDGIIIFEGSHMYICQNVRNGGKPNSKSLPDGYRYSWSIPSEERDGDIVYMLDWEGVTDLKLKEPEIIQVKTDDISISGFDEATIELLKNSDIDRI